MRNPTEVQQARRDNGPLTDRGAQRKAALLVAARRVFERKGFIDTRVADIAKEAKVSHGTFYTYFDTKDAVFIAVAHEVINQMLASMAISIPTADLEKRVRDSIGRFIEAYRPHAVMIGMIEQLAATSPELLELRLDVRNTFVQRTRRGIARMKDDGLTAPELDEEYIAEALGAMLEYTCYVWFCLNKVFEYDRMVDSLAHVWLETLSPASRAQR